MDKISEHLIAICNKFINAGVFRNGVEISKMFLFLKLGNKSHNGDYGPIPL